MLDETKIKEMLDVFDEVYETESETKDIVSGARTRVKETKTMMKDWAERNELNFKAAVFPVYQQYKGWRDGKIKWGSEEEADDYNALLIMVQDEAVKDKSD